MFQIQTSMPNSTTSLSEEQSVSSAAGTRIQDFVGCLNPLLLQQQQQQQQTTTNSFNSILTSTTTITTTPTQYQPKKAKKKRSLPGNPDPDAEVIALSPKTLLATNRFVCEICNKGFQRDQNLQLHRRGHNLPWKLKQRPTGAGLSVKKKAYVCPEPSCVHHLPSRALGDLTGIKKHFCRKHGEKKFKCEKCSKTYAVYSDWKAHSKTCGTREYTCDCGTIFSRKDSFITHRAFCDALAEESARLSANYPSLQSFSLLPHTHHHHAPPLFPNLSSSTQNFPNNVHVIPPQQAPNSSLTDPWETMPPHQHHQNPIDQHRHLVKPELSSSSSLFPPPLAPQPPLTSVEAAAAAASHNKSLLAPTFHSLQVSTTQPANSVATSAAHLSATALLQKACKVGIASGHKASHDTTSQGHQHVTHNLSSNEMIDDRLDGGQLFGGHVVTGCTTVTPDQYMASLTAAAAATPSSQELTAGWQKSDGLTRDFLGLTGHDEEDCRYGGDGGGGGVHVGVNMQGLLKFSMSGDQAGFAAATGDDTHNTSATVYERGDHSSLLSRTHHQVFGFTEPPASDNWGHC